MLDLMENDEDTAMPELPVPKAKSLWLCSLFRKQSLRYIHSGNAVMALHLAAQVAQHPSRGLIQLPSRLVAQHPSRGLLQLPSRFPSTGAFLGLTAEQAAQVDATKIVRCAWFGPNGRSVPVKNSLESALVAFDNLRQRRRDEEFA